ncbi:MAG: protein kinase [Proteobacteria bacterium]|nr:protein kinase [Pseudomonadota bacterium]
MPRCRKCKKDWPAGMSVCPDDGYSFTVGVEATMIGGGGTATPAPAPAKYAPTGVLASGIGEAAAAATTTKIELDATALGHMDLETSDVTSGTMVGEYKVEKKIGEGGMGAVYSAIHPMIGKRAAIKVISAALGADPSAVQRFVQEARSVNQIGHPNIVDVFAFGTLADGRNYFVMEYLQGESLADRIHRTGLMLGEAIEILDQVADALEAAHEKQIVHRDLKPDNVYLAAVRGGRTLVKLLDFGIAKLSTPESEAGGVAKTRTGMMMGTPGYLSPEQARGRNVDRRTDVYALGCMMYEIVCGRLPFVADSAMDMVLMHMTTPPQRPSELWPEIPPPLELLIVGMLDKHPDNRPTLAQVRTVLSELISSGLVTIDNGRPTGFRSSLQQRINTPAAGVPLPLNGTMPLGTNSGQPAPSTRPPGLAATPTSNTSPPVSGVIDTAAPRKKTALYAAIAGVAVVGGIGAFVATRTPAETTPPKIADVQPPTPPATTVTPPTKSEPAVDKTVAIDAGAPPVVAPVPKGGTIELTIADKSDKAAKVEVDGKVVAITGPIAVDADGSHTIVVTVPGKLRFEQKVEVAGGAKATVQIAKLDKEKKTSGFVPKTPGTGSAKVTPPGPGSAKKGPDDGTIDPFAN